MSVFTSSSSLPSIHAERRARRFWVALIAGLLSLQIVIGITSIVLSVGDPSVSVVPNYHQTALDWDVTHRELVLAQRLGWTIDTRANKSVSATGKRPIEIGVKEQTGNCISGLMITGQIYHHARGSNVYRLDFEESVDGHYLAMATLDRIGLWQLELQIQSEYGIVRVSRQLEVQ